jgi:ribosomal protein S26
MSWFNKLFGGGERGNPGTAKQDSGEEGKLRCQGCGKYFPQDELRNITVMSMDGGNRFSRLCRKCEEKHPLGL